MAKTIGKCICATKGCDSVADVREMKGHVKGSAGKLYLYCPDCGVVRSSGKVLQDFILKNSDMEKNQSEVAPEAVKNAGGWW